MPIDHIHLRKLDLNLLLAFDALMQTESVSAAAARLSVGQPAMSHSLRRLRDLFGDPLLVREGGVLRPTDRALALWAPVRAALEGLETGLEIARGFDPAAAARVFRLSLPDYLAAKVLGRLLQAGGPGLRFRIESFDREDALAALETGRLDALVGLVPSADGLAETPLFEDDFVTLYDPDAWDSPPDTLGAFCAADHLLVSLTDSFEGWVDEQLAELGCRRRVAASLARFSDAPACIRGSRRLVTLPRRAAAEGALHGLGLCPPPLPPRRFTTRLYRRARAAGAPASDWLAAQITAALAD